MNQKLIPLIHELKNHSSGNPNLNPHCFQSPGNLHQNRDFNFLYDKINTCLKKAISSINGNDDSEPNITAMWACINDKHGYNNAHVHQNTNLTGVYYVQTPDKCGELIFHDPRVQLNALCPASSASSRYASPRIKVTPKAGQLVVFPGWLLHHVMTNKSNDQRIIIGLSCNYS